MCTTNAHPHRKPSRRITCVACCIRRSAIIISCIRLSRAGLGCISQPFAAMLCSSSATCLLLYLFASQRTDYMSSFGNAHARTSPATFTIPSALHIASNNITNMGFGSPDINKGWLGPPYNQKTGLDRPRDGLDRSKLAKGVGSSQPKREAGSLSINKPKAGTDRPLPLKMSSNFYSRITTHRSVSKAGPDQTKPAKPCGSSQQKRVGSVKSGSASVLYSKQHRALDENTQRPAALPMCAPLTQRGRRTCTL